MNGYEDVRAVVRTVTDLPIMVVNTHGHCDHIYGNVYFDCAYLHPADLPVAQEHMRFPEFIENVIREAYKCRLLSRSEVVKSLTWVDFIWKLLNCRDILRAVFSAIEGGSNSVYGRQYQSHLWMQLEESSSMPELSIIWRRSCI